MKLEILKEGLQFTDFPYEIEKVKSINSFYIVSGREGMCSIKGHAINSAIPITGMREIEFPHVELEVLVDLYYPVIVIDHKEGHVRCINRFHTLFFFWECNVTLDIFRIIQAPFIDHLVF